MESFLVSVSTVAIAEMGDRTQLLSLMLAARYRRPWTVLLGVLAATLANHTLAAFIGVRLGRLLTPTLLHALVGSSMIGMALWTLRPDTLEKHAGTGARTGALLATAIAFFLAEMGDKTQLATVALAAAYSRFVPVIAGTTTGMLLANAPVIFLGQRFAGRLPLKALHYGASAVFLPLGAWFLFQAARHGG
jgi:putative Ca2+/H+ antiporter (TMEM165/GDT1 family)